MISTKLMTQQKLWPSLLLKSRFFWWLFLKVISTPPPFFSNYTNFGRAVGRSEYLGGQVVFWWAYFAPLVGKGSIDLLRMEGGGGGVAPPAPPFPTYGPVKKTCIELRGYFRSMIRLPTFNGLGICISSQYYLIGNMIIPDLSPKLFQRSENFGFG